MSHENGIFWWLRGNVCKWIALPLDERERAPDSWNAFPFRFTTKLKFNVKTSGMDSQSKHSLFAALVLWFVHFFVWWRQFSSVPIKTKSSSDEVMSKPLWISPKWWWWWRWLNITLLLCEIHYWKWMRRVFSWRMKTQTLLHNTWNKTTKLKKLKHYDDPHVTIVASVLYSPLNRLPCRF